MRQAKLQGLLEERVIPLSSQLKLAVATHIRPKRRSTTRIKRTNPSPPLG
jgi:hypothetical protein